MLDALSLGSIGDSLALGDFRRGIHLLEEVGDGEDTIGALEDGSNGLGGVQVGLALLVLMTKDRRVLEDIQRRPQRRAS